MVLRFVTFLLVGITVVSCSSNSSESANKNETEQQVSAFDAVNLFNTHCSTCHGLDGSLGVGGAKDLSKSAMDLTAIRKTIQSGTIGGMPRFKETFTTQEIDAVAQYVITLKRK
ncbi:MAG TPA: cytochrome c [Taishania sp.]|nr:cytochrome c [Taishania sp.]HNS42068.1 cytochrome c [Taishania sp.]